MAFVGNGGIVVKRLRTAEPQVRRRTVQCSLSRRDVLQGVAGLGAFLMIPERAGASQMVNDSDIGFEFSVPDDYETNTTVISGGRKLYLFVKGDANVSAVATPITGDFQKLTSFGTVDNVASTLLPGSVKGKMNAIVTKTDKYIFDYNISPPKQPEKHLLTLFTIRPGQYIVTITAQCNAENFPAREQELRSAIDSFILRERPGYN